MGTVSADLCSFSSTAARLPAGPYNTGGTLYVLIRSNYGGVRGYHATQLGELRRLSAKPEAELQPASRNRYRQGLRPTEQYDTELDEFRGTTQWQDTKYLLRVAQSLGQNSDQLRVSRSPMGLAALGLLSPDHREQAPFCQSDRGKDHKRKSSKLYRALHAARLEAPVVA